MSSSEIDVGRGLDRVRNLVSGSRSRGLEPARQGADGEEGGRLQGDMNSGEDTREERDTS